MKEAIGTSFVFNLMMIFIGVLIAMFVGSLAYTKGFKVRNKIIDIIEKYEKYDINDSTQIDEINDSLSSIGYQVRGDNTSKCKARGNANQVTKTIQNNDYEYCVYEYNTSRGKYYGVTVFIHVDIPLIGGLIDIPLYGESRLVYSKDLIEG